jgi:hypothetical protein
MVGGVGTGVMAHQLRPDADPAAVPKATPSATATTKKTEKPESSRTAAPGGSTGGGGGSKTTEPPTLPIVPVSSLRIVAGAVGPVQVGMSKLAAYGTGYFDADVSVPACNRIDDLVWKRGYSEQLDVLTHDDGSVQAIGVRGAGPRTRSGLGVGSTYESVRGVIGEVAPEEAGYNQTGLFVSEGAGWIGFLFNTTPDAIAATDTVSFVEVTSGAKPGLMRDGC